MNMSTLCVQPFPALTDRDLEVGVVWRASKTAYIYYIQYCISHTAIHIFYSERRHSEKHGDDTDYR